MNQATTFRVGDRVRCWGCSREGTGWDGVEGIVEEGSKNYWIAVKLICAPTATETFHYKQLELVQRPTECPTCGGFAYNYEELNK